MRVLEAKDWQIDVVNYLKPYIPHNLVSRLLRPLSHFIGHRDRPWSKIGNTLVAGGLSLGVRRSGGN